MKLSELDKMLEDRRELVDMRSEMDEPFGLVHTLPECIKLAAQEDLMERSKANLLDIDERLMQWGVEIDLPHETEPEVFAKQAGKDEGIDK